MQRLQSPIVHRYRASSNEEMWAHLVALGMAWGDTPCQQSVVQCHEYAVTWIGVLPVPTGRKIVVDRVEVSETTDVPGHCNVTEQCVGVDLSSLEVHEIEVQNPLLAYL